jgi:hypothetical protein
MTSEDLRKLLRDFVGTNNSTMLAKVTDINKQKCTCTVEDDGALFFDVRLRSITGSNAGIIMYPKIGSNILVVKIEDTENWAMLSASEYESIEIEINSLIINGGGNGGLANTPELKMQLDKTNEALQAIITVLTGSPVPEQGNGSPSALQAALKIALSGKQLGDFSNIEDAKIKH